MGKYRLHGQCLAQGEASGPTQEEFAFLPTGTPTPPLLQESPHHIQGESLGGGAIGREMQGGQRVLSPRRGLGGLLRPDPKKKMVAHRVHFDEFPS